MPRCIAKKKDGNQCKGTAKQGEQWCGYHRKRFGSKTTHGRYASAELLGIPQNEKMTFDQFYADEKPFELGKELAYLRTLLVEQRKAMEMSRPNFRNAILTDFREQGLSDLTSSGVPGEHAEAVIALLSSRVEEVLNEYHGPAEVLSPGDYATLADLIERIARVAEKAKRIAEGITLNVDFRNVGLVLVKFVREVVMAEVKDQNVRARIVEKVRAMNLTTTTPTTMLAAHED